VSANIENRIFQDLPLTEANVQGFQYLGVKIGVISNESQLTYMSEYIDEEIQKENPLIWRNTTSLRKLESIPFTPEMDGYIYVINSSKTEPTFKIIDNTAILIGDFVEMEKAPPKRNNTLFGNGGVVTKFILTLLEKKSDIYSFHATGFYHEEDDELFICIGGPGAGKTVLLFEACLGRGYKVFTTEFLHVKVTSGELTFYKGAMYDNVRLGNLIYDFPESKEYIDYKEPDTDNIWAAKVTANFSRIQSSSDVLVNPRVSLLFPKIEGNRTTTITKFCTDPKKIAVELFLNASEIVNRPRAIYGEMAVTSMDTPDLAAKRLKHMKMMAESNCISQVADIFGGPKTCLDGIKVRPRLKV